MNNPQTPSVPRGLLATLIGFSCTGLSFGAVIVWEPSVQMYPGSTVDTFVDNSFGLDQVFAFSPSATLTGTTTLNGVGFDQINNGNTSSIFGIRGETITLPATTGHNTAFGDGTFTSNGDIYDVIASASWGVGNVTLSNLTVGRVYQMQIFTNDHRGGRNSDWQTGFSDGVNNFATSQTGGTAGFSSLSNRDPITDLGEPSGDYIIGTFRADSATQVFEIAGSDNGFASANSDGRAQINAFSLRSVPEPSRAVLLALGGLALVTRRRR